MLFLTEPFNCSLTDNEVESTPLTASEREAKEDANEKVAKLHQDLESKQAQRAKVKHIQEGARNKKKITLWQMQNIDGNFPPQTSRGNIWQENIRNFITEFYKMMIGVPVQNHNRLSHRPLIHRKFSRGKGSV
jgi:type I site-specific restriction endonuclease